MATLGLVWTLVTVFADLRNGENLVWATRFIKWPVMVSALGLILTLYKMEIKSDLISWLGKHSYLIYLSHVLFLQIIMSQRLTLQSGITFFLGVLAVLVSIKLKG